MFLNLFCSEESRARSNASELNVRDFVHTAIPNPCWWQIL